MLVAEGRTRASRATQSRNGCAPASARWRRASARRSRWSRCRRVRRCCRHSSRRSTGLTPAGASRLRRQIRSTFERTTGVVDVDWYVDVAAAKVDAHGRRREGRGRRSVERRRRSRRADGDRRRASRPAPRSERARGRADSAATAARPIAAPSTRFEALRLGPHAVVGRRTHAGICRRPKRRASTTRTCSR